MDDYQFNLFAAPQVLKPCPETILSWNVNGISKRLSLVHDLIHQFKPDVVCLQETRVESRDFPSAGFEERGYRVFTNSAGGHNGVAILSKVAGSGITGCDEPPLFGNGRAILFGSPMFTVLNIYAPNAPFLETEAFREKITWLRSLYKMAESLSFTHGLVVIIGDFNLAPSVGFIHGECLALYPGFLTAELTAAWNALTGLGYHHIVPTGEGSNYTWWSYKDRGFDRGVGMQIDHVLLFGSPAITPKLQIIRSTRELQQTSDHAPILLRL